MRRNIYLIAFWSMMTFGCLAQKNLVIAPGLTKSEVAHAVSNLTIKCADTIEKLIL